MRKEGSTLVKQTNPNENIEATPKSVWPLGGAYCFGDTSAHKEQWWTKCGSIVGRILAATVSSWRESPTIWNRNENTASRASYAERTETNACIRVNRDYIIRWPLTLTDDLIVREESEGHWSYRVHDYSISSERERERRTQEGKIVLKFKVSKPLRIHAYGKKREKFDLFSLALFFVLFRSFSR